MITDSHHSRRLMRLTIAAQVISNAPTFGALLRVGAAQAREVIGAGWGLAAVLGEQNLLCTDPVGSLPTVAALADLLTTFGQQTTLLLSSPPQALRDLIPDAGWLGALIYAEDGHVIGLLTLGAPTDPSLQFQPEDETLLAHLATIFSLAARAFRLRTLAERANHQRDQFIRLAAHELKNPITALRTGAQALIRHINRQPETERLDRTHLEKSLRTIEAQSRRLADVVADSREALRLYIGDIVLQPATIPLALVLEGVAAQVPQVIPVGHAEPELHLDVDATLQAYLDPVRIQQALLHLIAHAISTDSEAQSITLRVVGYRKGEPPSVIIALCLKSALAESEWRRMLAYLARRDAMPAFEGVGMDLFIAYRLIALHHGSLTVFTAPDNTICFDITLPEGEAN